MTEHDHDDAPPPDGPRSPLAQKRWAKIIALWVFLIAVFWSLFWLFDRHH